MEGERYGTFTNDDNIITHFGNKKKSMAVRLKKKTKVKRIGGKGQKIEHIVTFPAECRL